MPKVLLASVSLLLLASCGSGGNSDRNSDSQGSDLAPDLFLDTSFLSPGSGPNTIGVTLTVPPVLQVGYFLDSAVFGLNYARSDGFSGTTGTLGEFDYYPGDTIEFSVGDVSLGSIEAPASGTILAPPFFYVTPLTLTPVAASADHPTVLNKLIFLQTLDSDGDLSNGIQIPALAHAVLSSMALDFELPVDTFVNGVFVSAVSQLNASQAYTDNSPRTIQTKIAALRHFGNLNVLGLPRPTETFTAWWPEQNGCVNVGKSRLSRTGTSVEFCPNIHGFDGCYEGVALSSGEILLPEMKSNAVCEAWTQNNPNISIPDCAGYQQVILSASLNMQDDAITGEYEASCQITAADEIQTVAADFVMTGIDGGLISSGSGLLYGLRNQLLDEIQSLTANGSCANETECGTLRLQGSAYCSLHTDLAYSTVEADTGLLDFKQHVYRDVVDEIDSNQGGSGTTICYKPQVPAASCLSNICVIE